MAKRIKDMKKGNMYEWTYMGNKCVGHVTFTGPRVVRCHYAVGMWEDSEAVEDAEPDYLAIDINVADYDIEDIRDATIDQNARYIRVVKEYNELIDKMNEEYKKEPKQSNWIAAPVSFDQSQDNFNTIGEAIGDSELVRPELIDPADKVTRLQKGVTVVDKIDLDSIHPAKKTKEDKAAEREKAKVLPTSEYMKQWKEKCYREDLEKRLQDVPDEERNKILDMRFKDTVTGYRYKDEELVRFKHDKREGLAFGMVDTLNGVMGYYIAVNLYKQDMPTFNGEVLEDGTIAGEWPENTKISEPSKLEKSMEQFMLMSYLSHIDAVKEKNRIVFEEEQDRLRKEEEERKQREAEEAERKQREAEEAERLAKEEAERKAAEEAAQAAAQVCDEEIIECLSSLEHINYLNGTKNLLDNREWPVFSESTPYDQKLKALSELSRLIELMKDEDGKFGRTYILSNAYFEELRKRKTEYLSQYQDFAHLIGTGEVRKGVIVYKQHDVVYTVIFRVVTQRNGEEFVAFDILIDGHLFVTCFDSSGNKFKQPYRSTRCFIPEYETQAQAFVLTTMGLILCFLAMEDDAHNLILKITNGDTNEVGRLFSVNEVNPDVDVRDATWYTNIFINKTISVDSYRSHRWFGHGDDKELREVEVSAYTKGGYTMKAKVTK